MILFLDLISGGSALYYVDKERPNHKKYCLPTLNSEHWLLGYILLSPLISSYYYEIILLHLVEAHKVFRFSMNYVYVHHDLFVLPTSQIWLFPEFNDKWALTSFKYFHCYKIMQGGA